MNTIDNITDRLKYLRKDILKLNQTSFAEKLNLKQNSIAQIESNKRNMSDRTIADICREFNVNENWLREGNGEIFLKKSNEQIDLIAEEYKLDFDEKVILENYLNFDEEKRKLLLALAKELFATNTTTSPLRVVDFEEVEDEYIEIGTYEIKASAGLGNYLDKNAPKSLKLFKLNSKTVKADHAIIVNGHSMEPLIANEEIIFIKEQPALEHNEIGIFVYDGEIYCKKLIKENKKVILRSENPKYEDIIVNPSFEFTTIGKVLL